MSLYSLAVNDKAILTCNMDTSVSQVTAFGSALASTTVNGTQTQSSSSRTGSASYIFGTSGYVRYGLNNTNFGISNYGFEAVFKKSSTPTNWAYIGRTYVNNAAQLYVNSNGNLTFVTSNVFNFSGTTNVCDGKWHHVFAFRAGNNAYIYLDGNLEASASASGSWSNSTGGDVFFGGYTTSGYSFDGYLDFAAYYQPDYYNTGVALTSSLALAHAAEFGSITVTATPMTASSSMSTAYGQLKNLEILARTQGAAYIFPYNNPATGAYVTGVAADGKTINSALISGITYSNKSITGGNGSVQCNVHNDSTASYQDTSIPFAYVNGHTWEMVFKYVATPAYNEYMIAKSESGGGSIAGVSITPGGSVGYFFQDDSNNWHDVYSTSGLFEIGKWYHVVVTWDVPDGSGSNNKKIRIWVNNNLVGESTSITATSTKFDDNPWWTTGDSTQLIDFFAQYNYNYNGAYLTTSQIADHYNLVEANRLALESATIVATPMTASASMPSTGGYIASAMTASALMASATPVTVVNRVVSAGVSTASATLVDAGVQHDGNSMAGHMEASATFPEALVYVAGLVHANAMIATNCNFPNPSISAQKNALIKPSSLNASSFLVTPPAFVLLKDDIWYKRLLTQHESSTSSQASFLHFFTEASNKSVGDTITDQGVDLNNATAAGVYPTPTPKLTVGYVDDETRRAVNINNIAFSFKPVGAEASVYQTTDRGYTLEAMIKTTKSNQIMFSGDFASATGQNKSSVIGLDEGYLYIMDSFKSGSSAEITYKNLSKLSALNARALKASKTLVSDGAWHHVLVQVGYDGRTQFWIDGKLELQKYEAGFAYPVRIGYNSSDVNSYSDFYISAVSVNPEQFLIERDVTLNYYASINYTPIQPAAMIASAKITDNTKARGNRGRALMLYFWSTRGPSNDPISASYYRGSNSFDPSLSRTTPFDQGGEGEFDIDTFFKLNTWNNSQFYDWDIFPVDVQGYYVSEVVKSSSYDNPRTETFIDPYGTGSKYTYSISDGFKDEIDNRRYINLMSDLNIDDFDAIFFRNYPDQGSEIDSFDTFETVDQYFNIRESVIFQEFLTNLRNAIDTGASLYVTNPQLAVDLGIVDRIETVSDLSDISVQADESDTYTPTLVKRTDLNGSGWFHDTYKNNRHRVVNEIENLTTDPAWTWQDHVFFENDGAQNFAGINRYWNHYEYKNKLSIGDTFLIADYRENGSKYLAVPFENIKAGKAVTAFATTYIKGNSVTDNPYKNYATTIAVEPGDVLNGKQVGGKIFVSFTELINDQTTIGNQRLTEYLSIELKSDAIIDTALAAGAISQAQATEYKQNPLNIDRQLAAGSITQEEYDYQAFWQYNGNDIISSTAQYGDQQVQNVDTANGIIKGKSAKTRTGRNNRVVTMSSSGLAFQIQWGILYPTIVLFNPSITTRAMWWLSERSLYGVIPQRPLAATAGAVMVNPVVTGDKAVSTNAQSMLAAARITETANHSGNINIVSLPMTARAEITQKPTAIFHTAYNVTARFPDPLVTTSAEDEVILYVYHEDPILYIREDIIK